MLTEILNQLQFSWHSVPVVIVSTVIFCIGLFVWLQNRKSHVNLLFFIICLCVNSWLYGASLVYAAKTPETAAFFYKLLTFLGVALVAPCVYCFSVVWLKRYERQKWFCLTSLAGGAFFYLMALCTNLFFPVFHHRYFWSYYPHYGPFSYIFLVYFFSVFLGSFLNFVNAYRKEMDFVRKTQIKLIAIAFLISFIGSVDYIPKVFPSVPIYPIGFLCVFVWIMTVAYSIVKYKVMDIETVIHQTILWLASSLVVVLPIVWIFYGLKGWYRAADTGVLALLISALFFAFFFYLKTIQPHIDHFFKRRELDLERTLLKFNDSLVHLKDLAELSSYIIQTIHEVLYVDKIQIFLRHGSNGSFIRIDGFENGVNELSSKEPFVQWLEQEDRLALREFVDLDPRFEKVQAEAKGFFNKLKVNVAIPLVLNQELMGLINLGAKANLKPFRAAEIAFLSELRRAATIALSNSVRLIEMQESLRKWNEELEEKVKQRTHELEEAQKQLIQAEKLATLGTLAGGVAHEINNPLTAILTNIQLLKLEAKQGEDKESIELIEAGAKRCREIIQKIMKYARRPEAGTVTEKVNLNNVVEHTIAFLEYQLKQENVEVRLEYAKEIPFANANNNELVQVLTNLILNAKDAVKDTGRTGRIEIKTLTADRATGFSVKDNGHGISKEHLSKIFDPFFTTKDVGKGTGLGLAVTYGIVKKYDGAIDVESKPGDGTTFIITFPKST